MVLFTRPARPLWRVDLTMQCSRPIQIQTRSVSAGTLRYRTPPRPLPPPPAYRTPEAMEVFAAQQQKLPDIPPAPRHFKVHPPPGKSAKAICSEPLKAWNAAHIKTLDPSNLRTRLFSKENEEGAKPGDVLLVRFRSGDPFAGVCMSIRRRGVDTAILLRNQLTRVGTELSVKVYSPTVVGIEILERSQKKIRRARLYYMRKPKHDRGSLAKVVEQYKKRGSRGAPMVKRKAPPPGAPAIQPAPKA